jgi:hypothetical protein
MPIRRTSDLTCATVALLAAIGCTRTSQPEFAYEADVGVVVPDGAGSHCLVIPREAIDSGSTLQVVAVSFAGSGEAPAVGYAQVTGIEPGTCGAIHAGPSDRRYRVALPPGLATWGTPTVALHDAGPVAIDAGALTGDLDGDGTPEHFRMCSSTEGLHLTIWSGEPLVGTRRWHFYYYLGYDVEPDCSEADYAVRPAIGSNRGERVG